MDMLGCDRTNYCGILFVGSSPVSVQNWKPIAVKSTKFEGAKGAELTYLKRGLKGVRIS